MIEEIEELVKKEVGKDGWMEQHIASVRKYALILAEKLNADAEVVEIAALLHDITVLKGDAYHHITGAVKAEKMLKKLKYPKDKIGQVKHCIQSHRGSQNVKRETVEAECVASADAMAHFDNVPALLYLVYVKKKMGITDGKEWIKKKLEKSWAKLIPEAKALVQEKYDAAKTLLE